MFLRQEPVYFRNTIAERREKLFMTQATLAWHVGISRQGLFKIENNKVIPSVLTAMKLAHYLNVPIEKLFLSDWQYFEC